ncbi:zinc finger protein 576 isoform X1 [Moschus berezovskii]|uniref:zinc finger protein 576 isoform X1 n=2 Tax=Moschus berezovskii TaxID=68408 RepID=UPI0024449622|nr:zinc finger protein 576 isoform X1 [Moschus berezovskii]XP_055267978.1 zinc finger protein 576 isoform X1 [Moschus berezovskii]XP_055267979.1 zinc finger protein 576 isoform X1 [Moschus berezovskii]XP_055267980.1 zinc finger protein 576 isoform X1 [Moschus berezovskii]
MLSHGSKSLSKVTGLAGPLNLAIDKRLHLIYYSAMRAPLLTRGVPVTMEDRHSRQTMDQQDSSKERSSQSPGGDICHLGALQCTRCLITFADSKFQERHMKREHPADFVAQKLQGVLFICFTCARSFPSSKALITHQRGHGPAARPSQPAVPTTTPPTFPCPDCGKTFGQAASLRQHRQAHEARTLPGPFACTECGQDFAQEAGLHQHYIRHARGEL